MSKRKQTRPSELVDGLFLSKPWRDHSPEEQEAIYPAAQREADSKRFLDEHERWVDSRVERHGPELIWIDVKADASEVATIRRPASLPFKETIPELKLVDARPEVVEFVGTKGKRLRLLVADRLSVEEVESFASGTRLPSEKRLARSQTVETAERAKATKAKKVAALPEARARRTTERGEKDKEVLREAVSILSPLTKPISMHELARRIAKTLGEGWTQKSVSPRLGRVRGKLPEGKIQPPRNRSRD